MARSMQKLAALPVFLMLGVDRRSFVFNGEPTTVEFTTDKAGISMLPLLWAWPQEDKGQAGARGTVIGLARSYRDREAAMNSFITDGCFTGEVKEFLSSYTTLPADAGRALREGQVTEVNASARWHQKADVARDRDVTDVLEGIAKSSTEGESRI